METDFLHGNVKQVSSTKITNFLAISNIKQSYFLSYVNGQFVKKFFAWTLHINT